MAPEKISVRCCIAGGGPAGMMLGYLLARAGVEVLVLEKHGDFLRDFRGDTIHPSTLEVMHELGLLDEFLKLPHQKVYELNAQVGEMRLTIADFRHLPTRCGFVAFMPQWDFLNFLAEKAARYPNFTLMMEAEVTGLIEESGRVVGVRAKTPNGEIEVRADLVVGADGRSSIVREKAGLQVKEFGAPMDVLWFRLRRTAEDPAATMGRFDTRQDFYRAQSRRLLAVRLRHRQGTIRRDAPAAVRNFSRGDREARALRERQRAGAARLGRCKAFDGSRGPIARLVSAGSACALATPRTPCLRSAASASISRFRMPWRQPTFFSNRCAKDSSRIDHLRRIQKRRELPTRVTQGLQVAVQRRIIARVLVETGPLKPPLAVRLLAKVPFLRRIPARIVGLGIRPEHVDPALAQE